MKAAAIEAGWADVRDSHARYLREMDCQVVHASLHARDRWAREYVLRWGDRAVGHGSVAVGGPWIGSAAVFEFFVEPEARAEVFRLFEALLEASGTTQVLAQTNDVWLSTILHTWGGGVRTEKLLFAEGEATDLPSGGAVFRRVEPGELGKIFAHKDEPVGEYVLEFEGAVMATGGVLDHYNPPYGDVFMEVDARYRRRGFGAYLVQELKRVCREAGKIPCARCDPQNEASRQACLRAGFRPVGAIVSGRIGG